MMGTERGKQADHEMWLSPIGTSTLHLVTFVVASTLIEILLKNDKKP